MAAFPFTTIAPNVGRGYCLLPDPAPLLGLRPQDCRWAPHVPVPGRVGYATWQTTRPAHPRTRRTRLAALAHL